MTYIPRTVDNQIKSVVMVTDASYKHAVGIIRALRRAGHTVYAVSHHKYAPGFFSRFTSGHAVVPDPQTRHSAYIDEVIRWGRHWGVDVLLAVGYSSCAAVALARSRIDAAGLRSVGPDRTEFDKNSDKWLIIQRAREIGIQTPQTILADDHENIRRFLSSCGQCVAKYRVESTGQGVVYLSGDADWEARLAMKPASALDDGSPNMIIQERIYGVGNGYMALADHGQVVREFAHLRLREMPAQGGAATAAISIDDRSLMDAGRRLIEAIRWHGPAMVEFRSNREGHFLIEFNPKFWGSLELALACGADFPGDYCRMAMGESLVTRRTPSYRVGLRYWWPWRGDLRRLATRPGDLTHVLRDLLSRDSHSNWSWSDPVPNLVEIAGELTYPVRRHG